MERDKFSTAAARAKPAWTPEVISEGACSEQATTGDNDWPAIAISDQGSILVAWNAGGLLGCAHWEAGEQPTSQPAGCILPGAGSDPAWQPRLAAGGDDLHAGLQLRRSRQFGAGRLDRNQ